MDAHVIDHADDVLDLLGVHHVVRQVVVHFGVREVAALLAEHDEILKAQATCFRFSGRQLLAFKFAHQSLFLRRQPLAGLRLAIGARRNCWQRFRGFQRRLRACVRLLLIRLEFCGELLRR